jgi:peroxiredoxin
VSFVVLAARLVFASVLGVAAGAKLADRNGTRETLGAFGVPGSLSSPLAVLLPVAEALVALALLPNRSAQAAGAAGAALLAVFTGAVIVTLARGRRPDCNCFGALHSKPIGAWTVARNVSLTGIGVFVLIAGPGTSAFGWLERLTAAELGLTIAVVCLGVGLAAVTVFALGLFRQHGTMLLRLEALESGSPAPATVSAPEAGLAVGSAAPEFSLSGLDGETMTLASLRSHERPVLVLFTDPQCGPCNALLPEFGEWQREHERALTIAIVTRRDADANRPKAREHGLVNVLLQADNETADAFSVPATPAAVLVSAEGTVASPAALGADAIRALVRSSANRPPTVGDVAPPFELPDLAGRQRNLDEFRGSELTLLFWNPGCMFCNQMAADLRSWEDEGTGADLIVLAAGDAQANATLGIRSTVLLDPENAVAARFGSRGTPMAVRLDGEGRIASELAVGAEQVLALARRAVPQPSRH